MKQIASILSLVVALAMLANSPASRPNSTGMNTRSSVIVADSEGHGGGKGHRVDSEGHGGGKGPHKSDSTVYSA